MNAMFDQDTLDLPPGFTAMPLREFRDAFSHAQAVAADQGAGTLVWVRRFDSIEAAVVLEPEENLAEARVALYAGMNAVADALGAHCPPEKPLEFVWPDTILLDNGVIGGCRLASPADAIETEPPAWLVLGFQLRSVLPSAVDQPFFQGTSLATEGIEMLDGGRIIEGFARHLMAGFDGWRAKGFKNVADRYLARLQPLDRVRRGLAPNGDLLSRNVKTNGDLLSRHVKTNGDLLSRNVKTNGDLLSRNVKTNGDLPSVHSTDPANETRTPLTPALTRPQWLNPATGEPWL